jgi:hypothetical protein
VTSYDGGVFTVDRLSYGKAKLAIEYKESRYTAQLALNAGSRNRILVARIPSVRHKDEEGKLEIVEMIRPWEAPPLRTIEGTVHTPDGAPLGGVFLRIRSSVSGEGNDLARFAIADAAGRYRAEVPRGATFTVETMGSGEDQVSGTDVQAGGAFSVEAVVEAPDAKAAARARVRFGCPMGWRALGAGRTWVSPGLLAGNFIQFAADIPGYFPIFSSFEFPPGSAPPPAIVERFRFRSWPVRTLAVRSAGRPLAGAAVEIVPIDSLNGMEPVLPVSYTTGSDGRLQLAGDVAGEYGVIVSAPGHRTGRALWRSGVPLAIDLTPKPAAIEIAGLVRGWEVRVKPEGGDQAVAAFTADRSPATVTVDAARYVLLAFDQAGRVVGAARVTAVGGKTTRVSLAGGRNAEIRVTVPGPNQTWNVTVWSEWNANPEDIEDAAAQTQQGIAVLKVGAAGRYRVRAAREHGAAWLEREIEVSETGGALSIPPLTASLEGTRPATAGADSGFLILQAAEPGGWDLGLGPVELGEGRRFEFRGLPPGKYFAWSLASEGPPPLGLSGIPVVLEAGRTALWKDPAPSAGRPLQVRVTGAGGRPMPCALLYLDAVESKDRMGAEDSVRSREPRPRILVPVRNGTAELPHVGAGRLLLRLLSQRGHIYSLAADVTPGRTLEIRLPQEEP